MTHKVGAKGQVVIPKQLRGSLGLRAGDEVEFVATEKGVEVRPARAPRSVRGSLSRHDLLGALEADRRAEPR